MMGISGNIFVPAAVNAVSISKDSETLAIGDYNGDVNIFSSNSSLLFYLQ